MNIPSRTPEGEANNCPICGERVVLTPSRPPGDAPCPSCGTLLWFGDDARPVTISREVGRRAVPAEHLAQPPTAAGSTVVPGRKLTATEAAEVDGLYALLDQHGFSAPGAAGR